MFNVWPLCSEGPYRGHKLILDVMKSETGFSVSGIRVSDCLLFNDVNGCGMTPSD